ncbi:hypothetical protein Bbelb_393340 [Branchiostoma belcheri]|nr:hypothetical protein Bbelb_393340 [Branchiostoma belcheri]
MGVVGATKPSTSEAGRNPRTVGQQRDQPGQGRVQQVLPAEGQVQPPASSPPAKGAPFRSSSQQEEQQDPQLKSSQRRGAAAKFSSSVGAGTALSGRRQPQAPAILAASSLR